MLSFFYSQPVTFIETWLYWIEVHSIEPSKMISNLPAVLNFNRFICNQLPVLPDDHWHQPAPVKPTLETRHKVVWYNETDPFFWVLGNILQMEFHIYRTRVLKGWNRSKVDPRSPSPTFTVLSKSDHTTSRGKSSNSS